MPTISSGDAAEVTLQIGQQLTVSTSGSAIVDRRPWQTGTGEGSATVSGGQTFGPYDVVSALRIRATSGDASYSEASVSNVGIVVVSEADPVDSDGRPDGTLWLKVTP